MNDTIGLSPEVETFVAAVRARFSDLDPDEREDLLDGLEADMSDLVAERGPEALGDPDAYAAELRAAAGLPAAGPQVRRASPVGERVASALDGAHQRWVNLVSGLPGDPWGFAQCLRPAWWVLRAWIALQLIDLLFGSGSYNLGLSPVPSLLGWGLPLLLVAVVLSVQLGRGKVWPARRRTGTVGRVLLLVLNVLAIAATPAVVDSLFTPAKAQLWGMDMGYERSVAPQGLAFNGVPVANLYPYDAAGNPLVGVQLVDSAGRRLTIDEGALTEWELNDRVLTPWLIGRTPEFSVFPLAEQTRYLGTGGVLGEPALQTPPFAVLPSVTLEGVTPTETAPTKAHKPAVKKSQAKRR